MTMEQIYTVQVKENEAGLRMDKLLATYVTEVSRSFLQKLIDQGNIKVDGSVCRLKKQKLAAGSEVTITIPEPEEVSVEPQEIPLDIVYEDQDVLVVNKPKRLVVHPGAGNQEGTLVNGILYHCGDNLSAINGVVRPGIVHRIDKDTSGLLMIAKNDMAHRSLAKQLANHTITRAYVAIVYNSFKEDAGTVDAPIGRDPKNRLRQAVTDSHSRHAVTHYKVLERLGVYTMIKAVLETGRTHQIRVHMSHIGHPLLGDTVYGPKKNPFGVEGQMLHAKVLGFVHPSAGEYMEFSAPEPPEFQKVLQELRKRQ